MSVLREAISHATLGWVKPDLDEILRQAGLALEQFAEQPASTASIEACASLLHQAHGTLHMLELAAPAMVTEEMERLAQALRDGKVEHPAEASATLMRGTVLLPDYLERLQGGHRDIPIVLLPLLNDLRAARGATVLGEQALLQTGSIEHSEAELDHARSSLSGRNRALLESVGGAVKEELLQVKEQMDLYLRGTQQDPTQLQPQVETLGNVADTLQLLGMSAARAGVIAQRDALARVANGQQPASEDSLLDIAGALLHVDAAVGEQAVSLGRSSEDDEAEHSRNAEMRELVGVLIGEALNDLGEARRLFVAFIETNWDHAQLAEVPRLLRDVGGALRMLELEEPATYLDALRAYTQQHLQRQHRVPDSRQLDHLADALSSLEYYLEAVRDQRPRREDILEIARSSLDALGAWPMLEAGVAMGELPRASADTGAELSLVEAAANDAEPAVEPTVESEMADVAVAEAPPGLVPVEVVPAAVAIASVGAGFQARNEDIDDEIREVFLEEFAEEIDSLGRLLPVWRCEPENLETLRPIRRVFHTLKGSGRLVGADTLGEFSWKIENALNRVLDGSCAPSAAVVGLVSQAHATLPQLHQALQGQGEITADLAAMGALADRIGAGEDASHGVMPVAFDADDTATAELTLTPAAAERAGDDAAADLTLAPPVAEATELQVEAPLQAPVVEDAAAELQLGVAALTLAPLHDEAEAAPLVTAPDQDAEAIALEAIAPEAIDFQAIASESALSLAPLDAPLTIESVETVVAEDKPLAIDLAALGSSLSLEPLEPSEAPLPAAQEEAAVEVAVETGIDARFEDAADTHIDAVVEAGAEAPLATPLDAVDAADVTSAPDDVDVVVAADIADAGPLTAAGRAGSPASVDAVLLEILDAEINAHLATVDSWQADVVANGLRVDDRLLRAMHTINGAFAMTEVPEITEVTLPAEGYVKRLLAAGLPAGNSGFDAIGRTAVAVRETLAGLQAAQPWVPAFTGLAAELVALRDALPAPQPMRLDAFVDEAGGSAHEDAPHVQPEPAIAPVEAGIAEEVPAVVAEETGDAAGGPVASETQREAAIEDTSSVGVGADVSGDAEDIAVPGAALPIEHQPVTFFEVQQTYRVSSDVLSLRPEADPTRQAAGDAVAASEDAAHNVDSVALVDAGLLAALPGISLPGGGGDGRPDEGARQQDWDTAALETPTAGQEPAADAAVQVQASAGDDVEASPADAAVDEAVDMSAAAHAADAAQAPLDEVGAGGVVADEVAPVLAGAPLAAAGTVPHAIDDGAGDEDEDTARASADAGMAEDSSDAGLSEPMPAAAAPITRLVAAPEDPDEPLGAGEFDAELIDVFLEEGHDLLDHSDGLLSQLDGSDEDRERIAGLQRDLHTLKGGARMAGLFPVGDLSHAIESVLESASEQRGLQDGDRQLLHRGFDRLHAMLTRVTARRAIGLPQALIAELEARAHGDGAVPVVEAVSASAVQAAVTKVLKPLSAPIEAWSSHEDEDAAQPLAQEQVRVRADMLDRLVNNAGEVAIYRAHLEQQLGAFRNAMAEMEQTNARMRDQLRRLDIETEAQIVARYQREQDQGDSAFDPLELDRFSTLQQLSRALGESAADLTSLQGVLDDLARQYDALLHQQSRVSAELQDGLMRTRMLPFDTVAPRLRRVVRQAAEDSGKQVDFVMEGVHGELDRSVLQRMVAPLEHMLRNAVAHGLESSWARADTHKPAAGKVSLSLTREGSEMVLQVADDGAGLDLDAIRARGIERGLLAADETPSPVELEGLIFEPGFSTADSVSHLAGRGVGMDVVRNEVRQLGGSIDIASERGAGTTFTLRLPQTLAVTRAVLVQAGDASFAVPVAALQGVGRIDRARIEGGAAGNYRYGGEDYALYDLASLVGQPASRMDAQAGDSAPLLLINTGALRAAIVVDQWVGSREIVVKPVGPQIASVPGIHGATVLGDGRIAMILDLAPLVRRQLAQPQSQAVVPVPAVEQRQMPLVMVVDDSLTMRKVTGRVLERHNLEVMVARDGVEALERLAERVPDLLLLDIEMPRMDGYELATRMKADEQLRAIPIVMITSRTGDKHRQRAFDIGVERYMGKPYQEHDLMRNVYDLLGLARVRE